MEREKNPVTIPTRTAWVTLGTSSSVEWGEGGLFF